uniref:zincin-like metallopeptidase domain-containing protein n=1 Tax=Bacteroides fragilis TaxID=817 RepID=UPI003564AB75
MAKSSSKTEEYLTKFAEMVMEKMEEISSDWQKPWINVKGGIPQNLSGRLYNGGNSLMLLMHQEKEGYKLPVYMTYLQAGKEGVTVKRGEKSFPVSYWNFTIKNNETGEKISYDNYKNLSKEEQEQYTVKPFIQFYHVFNVEQTTMKELKPERWEELETKFNRQDIKDDEGKLKCPELDYMLENQTWLCPIHSIESNQAFYSPLKDEITIPLKGQFKNGEEFYLTELHEMAHSTGSEGRLDRELKNSFGDNAYAREELVAELTSAVVASYMGISPTINTNNIAYLNNWKEALKENSKIILSLLGDVSKSAALIQETVMSEEVKEKVKENTIKNIHDFITKAEESNKNRIPNIKDLENFSINEKKTGIHKDMTQKQYDELKKKYPDSILLFRTGDSYTLYNEDAKKASQTLELEIKGNKLSFLHTQLDNQLPKLVRAGMRVAICDSLEKEDKKETAQKTDAVQNSTKEELQEKKTLYFAYLGNGISYWEEGDMEYKGHIATDRTVTLKGTFTAENQKKIETMAQSGNIVENSTGVEHIVLNPINEPSKIMENTMTGQQYKMSVENIDGQLYACLGNQIMKKGEEIDSLMDLTPENMRLLDEMAEKKLMEKLEDLKETIKTDDVEMIERAKEAYLWAARYKLKDEYVYENALKNIEEIINDTINEPLKNNIMENENEKKILKDGISIFKMNNGMYGINVVKDGERSATKRLSKEDVEAYFDSLKGQPKEEVNRRREELAVKYFSSEQKQEHSDEQKRDVVKPLPKIDETTRNRIDGVSVFKMQDGKNYCVRAKIDNEQLSGVRVHPADIRAFFDGFKELSKEEQADRKAELAAKYYKNELESPSQQENRGLGR